MPCLDTFFASLQEAAIKQFGFADWAGLSKTQQLLN